MSLLPAAALASALGGIIGGDQAASGSWRWQVSIGRTNYSAYAGHTCGGAVIDPHWVVTAAHCVVHGGVVDPPSAFTVSAGSTDLNDPMLTRVAVTQVIPHENYNEVTTDNDIALLKLAQPLPCTLTPIPLVDAASEPSLAAAGTNATVTGWGLTANGATNIPSNLMQVQVPIVDRTLCNSAQHWNGQVSDNMLCAGYVGTGGKDSCVGDSGGPLVVPTSGGTGFALVGIVSWGDNVCAAPAFPGVYARVSRYVSWISGKTGINYTGSPSTNSGSCGAATAGFGSGGGAADPSTIALLLTLALFGGLHLRPFGSRSPS